MRRRSRRWRACVRAVRACVRACGLRGLPHTRERGCVRAQRVLDSTLAMHHEAGPSVQMMRVRFCLEAAEKPSYPAAYGILSMSMWSFAVLLSYVVWPRHMMVRRATSARGVVLFRFYGSAGGATGSGRRPFAAWGGCPLAPRACRAIPGGRAGRPPVLALVSSRLRHPRTMGNDDKLAPVRH